MIFVAVGTQKFQFDRLIREIDELIEKGKITEDVFAQIGHTEYVPKNYKYAKFLDQEEFNRSINGCSMVITHSGVATIMSAISKNKPVIVIPRLAKFGEHVDDHQVEIAESFYTQNFILLCNEIDNLSDMIEKAKTHVFNKYVSKKSTVISTIKEYLESCK